MGDGNTEMPAWVIEARRFIATGRQEFRSRAIDVCDDASVSEFLGCRELAEDLQVPLEAFQPLAESLEGAGRQAEAEVPAFLGGNSAINGGLDERCQPSAANKCTHVNGDYILFCP